MLLGVDVGGTFTDAVVFDGRFLHTAKAPTTAGDESAGVLAAVEVALERAGAEASEIEAFAHGMTVGTNALLEERGAKTALVATQGFTDLLDIGRQARPHLYRLCAPKPPALVEEGMKIEAAERTGPQGVIDPIAEREIERIVAEVEGTGAESVAICLLFSYLDPDHEQAIASRLRERLSDVHVSVSSEILAQFREYERCSTTVIDAYLSPLLGHYLGRLSKAANAIGLPDAAVMMSSGGVAPAAEAARAGAWSVLSGPAGGAIGAGLLARLSGNGNALGFDMGGTSCDVCVIDDGRVRKTDSREIGGRTIQLPMVDVHTVGAGGGSIAWRDSGGAMRVGPRSAGANPGPACYGLGGEHATVTDANLILGYLDRGSRLAGSINLDLGAAEAAIGKLAAELEIEPVEAAEGIVRIADNEMMRALRVVTVERGVDPRDYALLPFGGAGPMHAAAIATELGIERILCPRASGVLSALGLLASERRRDSARTVMLCGDELTAPRIADEVRALRRRLEHGLTDARAEVSYELRYRGQGFELAVDSNERPEPAQLVELFAAAHERRYGYRDPEAEIELVTIRFALIELVPQPELAAAGGGGEMEHSKRRARFGGEWVAAEVLRGEPAPGTEMRGPCVFELPESTLVLDRGWQARVDDAGTVVAERAP